MKENKIIIISAAMLSLAIIAGSIIISANLSQLGIRSSDMVFLDKGLINRSEAAVYLSLSEEEFTEIFNKSMDEKRTSNESVYPTHKYMPYIEFPIGEFRFSKSELDKWVEYNMYNK